MVDVRVVFLALLVLFTMILVGMTFTLLTGGYVKPLIDSLAPAADDPISTTEYLRISDRLYSTNRIVIFSGIGLVILGLAFYLLYFRQESPVGGFR